MSSLLLKNARLLGEKSETSCLIEDGIIKGFNINQTPDSIIDCAGRWLLPSMVDYQSFFNDDLESLETTAIDSGFCEVWAMLPDNRQNKSAGAHLVSPLTRIDENGTERLAEIGLAHKAGKSFFSNGNVAIKEQRADAAGDDLYCRFGRCAGSSAARPCACGGGADARGENIGGAGVERDPARSRNDDACARPRACAYDGLSLSRAAAIHRARRGDDKGGEERGLAGCVWAFRLTTCC